MFSKIGKFFKVDNPLKPLSSPLDPSSASKVVSDLLSSYSEDYLKRHYAKFSRTVHPDNAFAKSILLTVNKDVDGMVGLLKSVEKVDRAHVPHVMRSLLELASRRPDEASIILKQLFDKVSDKDKIKILGYFVMSPSLGSIDDVSSMSSKLFLHLPHAASRSKDGVIGDLARLGSLKLTNRESILRQSRFRAIMDGWLKL